MDVEAQDDGVMAKIVLQDGSKAIPVGTTIAVIGEEGDDISGADAIVSQNEAPAAKSEESKDNKPKETATESKSESSTSTTAALATPADETKYGSGGGGREAQKAPEKAGEFKDRPKFFASPLAKKLALERGIPLAQVKGTGPDGRIVKVDIENFKATSSAVSAETKTPTSAAAPAAQAEFEDIPVSAMRRTIGKRLTESKQNLPHYYVTVEINMDRVMKLRQVFNKAGDGKVKLSVNDFILKASSLALAEVPEANSAWLGDTIRMYKKADISVAVATPNGLITPIVKDVGGKGLASISAEMKALAVKARDGKLKPEEYQGGSFTISNLGMFGVDSFTAIINPPQSCILAIGGTSEKLVSAPEDPKGFKAVQVMNVTLSSDHRTVDGAVAAKWLAAFRRLMENPLTFML